MDSFCDIFGNQTQFCQHIDGLISELDRVNKDDTIKKNLDRLKQSVVRCIKNFGQVYVFGSRLYGIAKEDSDVDLYFDPGKIADDCSQQIQLINLLTKAADKEEFIGLQVITETRIPIVRFLHKPTNFKCDLQFRSGFAVLSSELVKLYLSMDERVHWVVVAVKHWAITLNLVSDSFSSFSLIWLVLFVMMYRKIVPPIVDLWKMHRNELPNFIEGWDTRICFHNDGFVSNHSKSNCTKWELLCYFFEFYSDLNTLQNYVLCTVFGELLAKENFYSTFINKVDSLCDYHFQVEKFETCKTIIDKNFGNFYRIELQNPLKLCNNVIPWLNNKNMILFINLCKKFVNSV